MKCTHFYITDAKGEGICKFCEKKKQFKGYDTPDLSNAEIKTLGGVFVDTERCATVHLRWWR